MKKKIVGVIFIVLALVGIFLTAKCISKEKPSESFEVISTSTTVSEPTSTPEPTATPEPTSTPEPTPTTVVIQELTPIPTTDIQMVESGRGMSILEMKLVRLGIDDDWENDEVQRKEKVGLTVIFGLAFLITVVIRTFFKREKEEVPKKHN